MSNASRDDNSVPTIIAVNYTDGQSVVRLIATDTTHRLHADFGTTGVDLGPTVAQRDDNQVTTLLAVSSVDGKTPVALYAKADGSILLDSN